MKNEFVSQYFVASEIGKICMDGYCESNMFENSIWYWLCNEYMPCSLNGKQVWTIYVMHSELRIHLDFLKEKYIFEENCVLGLYWIFWY